MPVDEAAQSNPVPAPEARALRLSMIATSILAVLGLVWGLISDAGAVLFIGIYLLASIVLVAVSMVALRTSSTAPSAKYPFGRHAAIPLAVALQGATLLGTVVYGLIQAITVFIDGGSTAPPSALYGFGLVLAGASLVVLLLLRRSGATSPLTQAEVTVWRVRLVLALLLVVGGLLAQVVAPRLGGLADPIVVLGAGALIIPQALTLVRGGGRELLEAAPDPRLQTNIEGAVATGMAEIARTDAGRTLPTPSVRAAKLGQRLYVEVQFVVEPDQWRVEDEDAVRRAIATNLAMLALDSWTTVSLTTDTGD